jgi:rhodanese-related sulfurtransferase
MACEPIAKDLSYDDIIALKRGTEIILIDVREPSEIIETGRLPGSVHIPRKFLHIHIKYEPGTENSNSNLTFL